MSILQNIHKGRRVRPPRILVHGTEGIGKSTLASNAPNPIFIPTEDGLDELGVDSFPRCTAFDQVMSALTALANEAHEYQTVTIDSLDWCEQLIWDAVCQKFNVDNIEKAAGGYGRGYQFAVTFWRKLLTILESLRDKGMCIILLAHTQVVRFDDPESAAYDRYTPRLHKHGNAVLTEWVDAILFATRKIATKTEEAGFNRQRTIASGMGRDGGDRILRCIGSPACIAKNRYNLPAELPLEWDVLFSAIKAGQTQKEGN